MMTMKLFRALAAIGVLKPTEFHVPEPMVRVTGMKMLREYLMTHRPEHYGAKVLRYDVARDWMTSKPDDRVRIVRVKVCIERAEREGRAVKPIEKWLFYGYLDDVVYNVERGFLETGAEASKGVQNVTSI